MLGVFPPRADVFPAAPIRNRDAESDRIPDAPDSEESRLLGCQFDHPLGHVFVAPVTVGSLRGENDREVGRLGCPGGSGVAHGSSKPAELRRFKDVAAHRAAPGRLGRGS
jgi:hypothetical protein